MNEPAATVDVSVTVNGQIHQCRVDARMTVADLIRDVLDLRGTKVGCEHGVCGACTILVDGASARSCTLFAPQVDGAEITTVEGLEPAPGELHPLQECFRRNHALQCGFCTAGFLMFAHELLTERRGASEQEVRDALSGNVCRCTGYQGIVDAVMEADRSWER